MQPPRAFAYYTITGHTTASTRFVNICAWLLIVLATIMHGNRAPAGRYARGRTVRTQHENWIGPLCFGMFVGALILWRICVHTQRTIWLRWAAVEYSTSPCVLFFLCTQLCRLHFVAATTNLLLHAYLPAGVLQYRLIPRIGEFAEQRGADAGPNPFVNIFVYFISAPIILYACAEASHSRATALFCVLFMAMCVLIAAISTIFEILLNRNTSRSWIFLAIECVAVRIIAVALYLRWL